MFEQAVELNPNYTDARLNLMVTLNELGEYKLARELYESTQRRTEGGTKMDPYARGKIANMHADLSQAYCDVSMPFEAVRELEHAVALCPQFADLRTRLGVLYRDAGEAHRAREQFELAKEANPRFLRARVLLGALLLGAGSRDQAQAELSEVLRIDPEEKTAQMYLRVLEQQARAQN
jgi:tetratricopeptide (TPR) repeat protein